jgi:hypothetical protein
MMNAEGPPRRDLGLVYWNSVAYECWIESFQLYVRQVAGKEDKGEYPPILIGFPCAVTDAWLTISGFMATDGRKVYLREADGFLAHKVTYHDITTFPFAPSVGEEEEETPAPEAAKNLNGTSEKVRSITSGRKPRPVGQ